MWKKAHTCHSENKSGGWRGGRGVVDQTACNRNHTYGTQLSTPPAVKCKHRKIPIII
jgi:hypothetical protein